MGRLILPPDLADQIEAGTRLVEVVDRSGRLLGKIHRPAPEPAEPPPPRDRSAAVPFTPEQLASLIVSLRKLQGRAGD